MQNIGNITRLVVVIVLAFIVYQVILTPAQRNIVVETVQQAVNSNSVPTVIKTIPTAVVAIPTISVKRVQAPQPAATVISNSTVGNDPPNCIVTTDYRDGHQFCGDGRGFSDDDPRKQPWYCKPIEVDGGWWECENGARMDAIVNIPVPDAPPTPEPWPTAAPADYIITNGCVLAVSHTDNQPRTVCPPKGTTWQEREEISVVAQMIIDGKFDNILPNGTGSGPKG